METKWRPKKRRRIRFDFIGGRRPALLDHFARKRLESQEKEQAANIEVEEQKVVDVCKVIEDEVPVTINKQDGHIEVDKANKDVTFDFESHKPEAECGEIKNKSDEIENKHMNQMKAVTASMNVELEKWKQLVKDFGVFDEFDDDKEEMKLPKPFCDFDFSQNNEELLQLNTKLQMKNMEMEILHRELELKTELVEQFVDRVNRGRGDTTLNPVPETPRHLIKKLVSLK